MQTKNKSVNENMCSMFDLANVRKHQDYWQETNFSGIIENNWMIQNNWMHAAILHFFMYTS